MAPLVAEFPGTEVKKTRSRPTIVLESRISFRTDSEIVAFLVARKFERETVRMCLPLIENEDGYFEIMEKGSYDPFLCRNVMPLFRLEEKTEEEIFDIMERTGFERHVCRSCLPYLRLAQKSEYEILDLLKRANFNKSLCRAGIPFLRLGEKALPRLKEILRAVGYNSLICEAGIDPL